MRLAVLAALFALACRTTAPLPEHTQPFAVVLGIAQDGGYPQAGCNRPDCIEAWRDPALRRHVASLAIVDPVSGDRWLIDATPDFPSQLRTLDEIAPGALPRIFLTHAHVGHYAGLMHLGREVMGTSGVEVYAMPRMREFLEKNGPWSQLVRLRNIELKPLEEKHPIVFPRIAVMAIAVPHRDEFSETVAFLISGPSRKILWLPDIDKWEKWTTPIESMIARVDVAYIDATFYDERELPGRNLSEIPHPTITETMQRLAALPAAERAKVRFIHFNQSNPALRDREVMQRIRSRGFNLAAEREKTPL
ncbi:MAG TPA: MBL fold metallo-hydrolase [Thermoanaerobaculia bacterium]|nr:MBL fold metallo-hydrolase [Thermoanaerobaculia bacterium]